MVKKQGSPRPGWYPVHIEWTIGLRSAPLIYAPSHTTRGSRNRTVIAIDDLTDKDETLALARERVLENNARTAITLVAVQKRRP